MALITTRSTAGTGASVKNAPLSNAEVDNNFINLNSELIGKLEIVNPTYSGILSGNGSIQEKSVAVPLTNILDLSLGNYFTKTITTLSSFTVSNVPATGTAVAFILDITNGGSAAITWWTNTKWAGGIAPVLTTAGRDVLGFFTYNAGTTWTGILLGKDVK